MELYTAIELEDSVHEEVPAALSGVEAGEGLGDRDVPGFVNVPHQRRHARNRPEEHPLSVELDEGLDEDFFNVKVVSEDRNWVRGT